MAALVWTKSFARVALLMLVCVGAAGFAQSSAGSLTGRLTDLYSKPLNGAIVVIRNRATGAETRTITAKNGAYRFSALGPGEYSLEADSAGLGQSHLDGIVISAGHEARVQIAVDLQPFPSSVPASKVAEAARPKPPQPFQTPPPRPRILESLVAAPPPVPIPQQTDSLADPNHVLEKPNPALPGPSSASETQDLPFPETALQFAAVLPTVKLPAHLTTRSVISASLAAGSRPANLVGAGFAVSEFAGRAASAVMQLAQPAKKSQNGDPGDRSLISTISSAEIAELPLVGRDWQNLVFDSPPTETADADDDSQPSSRGLGQLTAVAVDGSSTRLAFRDSGAIRAPGRNASFGPGVSETAIREVQSASGDGGGGSGYEAGRRANISTQRGAKGFHGQEFLLDRENLWGARNPFTQWVQQISPATLTTIPVFAALPYTPGDSEKNWGVRAGGPIHRDRLFWFGAIDNEQRNDPGVSTVKHPDNFFAQPSDDQMQVLSARLGLSSANPVGAGLAAHSAMLQTLDGLLGPASRTSNRWTGFARVDWDRASRQRFTLEANDASRDAPGGGETQASESFGSHSYGSSRTSDEWLLGRWEATAAPNLLVVTQGSLGRHLASMSPESPSTFERTLNNNVWGRLPQIVVDSRYGFTIGNPARFGPGSYPDEHLYQAQQRVDWRRGGLLLRAGFELRHNNDTTSFLRNQTGTYSYSSVENFASDALSFAAFGLNGQLNPMNQHNCDQTGKVWRDSDGTLHGLGYLPCYSYYSQTLGPSNWWLSTNDWAGYLIAQGQPKRNLLLSLGMRWELEQSPPPIAAVNNPDLPLTQKLPSLGSGWGPRASLAWGSNESRLPVLRLGYGMYFGRTPNLTLETALTQTGSPKGDLNYFMRPTDNLNGGGAPPFPYVLAGAPGTIVTPGAVEFAPNFRNGQIHQGVASLEESLPGHVRVEASAVASLGRRLPVTLDANIDPAVNPQTITYAVVDGNGTGPIKRSQITVPFFASWPSPTSSTGFSGRLNPNYQQITEIFDRANSTYEAAMLRLTRNSRGGLTLHARYTYAHAMDWNPNERVSVIGPSVFDPTNFRQEYGTSNLDVRNSASTALIWEPKWKLGEWPGRVGNGWMLSGIGTFHSGLPYTMRTSGSLAKEFDTSGTAIVALSTGMNGYGGTSQVYGVGRNTFRYPATWKADMRVAKHFDLGSMRMVELLAESFNLFNHQNVTQLESVGYSIESGSTNGSFPTLNYLTGLKTGQTEFGQPLNINGSDFYRQRQIQFGIRMTF